MKKQAFNPYLPSWEYVPDGEPYVFGERVYIFGSHDMYNGHVFCLGDYVCWSAPVNDLGDWKYEGVIYKKTQDPLNKAGKMCLYAPDVTVGSDGRYYLYYVLDKVSVVSVAVSDKPQGPYEFYGYVHDKSGNRIGERAGDEPQFDPAVLTEGTKTYLYTGFCAAEDTSRHGAMAMVLGEDMLTVETEPAFIVPSHMYGKGSGFDEHEFFEASSIRKKDDKYYFVYSTVVMHELCYAISDNPLGDFRYGGVVVSNCDIGIDDGKPAGKPMAYGANNHGSIIEINGKWYVFYHRHTNNSWYCRQGCAERIDFEAERIIQAQMTSCGLNDGPLNGKGVYPAHIACNIFRNVDEKDYKNQIYVDGTNHTYIMQEGRDGEKDPAYITAITDGTYIGFKYFDCKAVKEIKITIRGYAKGDFMVMTAWDEAPVGQVAVDFTNVWEEYCIPVNIPDGINAIFFKFSGTGTADLLSFELG